MKRTTPPQLTWSRLLGRAKNGPRPRGREGSRMSFFRRIGPYSRVSSGPAFKFQANMDHKIAGSEVQDRRIPKDWTTPPARARSRLLVRAKNGPRPRLTRGPRLENPQGLDHAPGAHVVQNEHLPRNWTILPGLAWPIMLRSRGSGPRPRRARGP